jgi:hypothetical protein
MNPILPLPRRSCRPAIAFAFGITLCGASLPAQIEPDPAPPTYGSSAGWERSVAAEARRFLGAETFRVQHPDDWADFECTGVSLVQHPRLATLLPRLRFYFVHVRQRRLERARDGQVELFDVHLYLAYVDTVTGRATMADRSDSGAGEWRFDALSFLSAHTPPMRTRDDVVHFHEAYDLLQRLRIGAVQPCATRRLADTDWITKRFGLGMPTPLPPAVPALPPRVVESAAHWFVVYASARCDDHDLPVQAAFELLRVVRRTGVVAGIEHEKGTSWPSHDYSEAAFAAEIDRFCAELAARG